MSIDRYLAAPAGAPPPAPPPSSLGERGGIERVRNHWGTSSPFPHAVCGRKAGDGGRVPGHYATHGAGTFPCPTSPGIFWGRWARSTSREGAPRAICPSFAILLLAISALLAPPAAAQAADSVEVAGIRVQPDTVTVGGRFRAAVFVRAPAGSRVELVVPPARDGAYQTVDSVRVYPPDSAGLVRAVATMVLWVTDPAGSARAGARVTLAGGGVRAIPVLLPLPFVRAVLPPDSARPRPPKDIIPIARRSWTWAWIAAGVLAALALLGLWWWRRRRRPRAVVPVDPRKHALAELDRLRASGAVETEDEVEAFSAGVSRILREFAAAADPALGTDLTTEELIHHLRRTGAREEDVESVAATLMHADLAKFARARPTPERALEDWKAARRWVQTFRAAADSAVPELAGSGR